MTSQMAAAPQARCQERWLELQFTFHGAARCWSTPQLQIWLLPVGVCTVGFLPIWIHQVRGCISTQQLWNWHALDCLLTVIFLLDFIKTPSVVSADKESNQKYPWREGECKRACGCSAARQDQVTFHVPLSSFLFLYRQLSIVSLSSQSIFPRLILLRKQSYIGKNLKLWSKRSCISVSCAGMETNGSLHMDGAQQQ